MKILQTFFYLTVFSLALAFPFQLMAQKKKPLRIGIAGLTHTHVHWIFNSARQENIEIVGIAEPDRELALRYAKQYNYPESKIYSTLGEMLSAVKPEAVAAFNSIYQHLEVVQQCAPLGIHVMVEKPLAVSLDHAKQMEALATRHKIYLLTNYETTWYATVHKSFELLHQQEKIGLLRKMVVHDGHKGPKEIGVNKEFLNWLTDSVQNGGGALVDFGCYGAVLSTWMHKGKKPLNVTAVTQQFKPEVYNEVDDEATLVLTYPGAQTIIQASWNWPFSRKDMELYGTSGTIMAKNKDRLLYRYEENSNDSLVTLPERASPYHDPFEFFRAVVWKEIVLDENDLSGLPLNMTVMEILEAAKISAKEKRTVELN